MKSLLFLALTLSLLWNCVLAYSVYWRGAAMREYRDLVLECLEMRTPPRKSAPAGQI